jgi:hypothetical protein
VNTLKKLLFRPKVCEHGCRHIFELYTIPLAMLCMAFADRLKSCYIKDFKASQVLLFNAPSGKIVIDGFKSFVKVA